MVARCFVIIGFLLLHFFPPFFSFLGLSYGTATISPPSTEQGYWTVGSPMPTPGFEVSAEALNGKIYVVGGSDDNGDLTDIVEVYDLKSDKWSTAAPIPEPLDHTGLASYEGKLYLIGGFKERRTPTDTLFIYDPQTDTWKEGSPMPTARAGLSADFIDGILYAVGGSTGDNRGQKAINEAYNPVTDKWEERASMPTARHHHTSA